MQFIPLWKAIAAKIVAAVLFVSLFGAARAESIERQCSKLDERAAESVVGKLVTWAAVHDAYLKFAHCDDGGIGEGFSESVTTLLAKRWSQFEELKRLAKRDEKFETFVLRHIDATVPLERLDLVRQNALRRCTSGTQLCKKIAKTAASARQEARAAL